MPLRPPHPTTNDPHNNSPVTYYLTLYHSLKTKDFTRLYLDVASINGLICQRTGSGDDDISLSSIEDDDDDESEENNDEHEHDKLIRAQDPTNNEHDEFINHAESISNEIESVGIHVQEENNAKISIEMLTAREQQSVEVVAEVVDLTISPSTRQLTSTISSQSNDDPRELERVTRIAKKFKRQFLQKNLQYKEQYNEKRKISERVRQVDKELLEMQGGMDELDRDQKMTILHLKESRLSLQRTVTERDMLKSQYLMMEEGKSKLDNQLKKCHLYYGKELEKARMKSMSEGLYSKFVCSNSYGEILQKTSLISSLSIHPFFLISTTNNIILL